MNRRNLELDRLRALIILIVVYFHLAAIYFPWGISLNQNVGMTFLDLTFALSGYVISVMIVKNMDGLRLNKSLLHNFIKGFYLRRFLRIFPAAAVVILLVMFCSIFFNKFGFFSSVTNTLYAIMRIATLTFNYVACDQPQGFALAPYWTLVIEEQFYILFPLFILLTKNNQQRVYILLCILVLNIFIWRPVTLFYAPVSGLFYTQTHLDGFIYGCLIYFMSEQVWFNKFKALPMFNKYIRVGLMLGFCGIFIYKYFLPISENAIFALMGLVYFIMMLLVVGERNIFAFSVRLNRWLEIIGLRAYSIYLIHSPIIMCANELRYRLDLTQSSWSGQFAIFTLWLIAGSAEVLYRYVEKPLWDRGKVMVKKYYSMKVQTDAVLVGTPVQ